MFCAAKVKPTLCTAALIIDKSMLHMWQVWSTEHFWGSLQRGLRTPWGKAERSRPAQCQPSIALDSLAVVRSSWFLTTCCKSHFDIILFFLITKSEENAIKGDVTVSERVADLFVNSWSNEWIFRNMSIESIWCLIVLVVGLWDNHQWGFRWRRVCGEVTIRGSNLLVTRESPVF